LNSFPNLKARGVQRKMHEDVYHYLLKTSWVKVFGLLFFIFLLLNAIFTCLYLFGGDCLEHARYASFANSFIDSFFFSLQTITTIGYGNIYPKNLYAEVIVFIEAFCGLIIEAMATGLMFAKFSIPQARIVFSNNVVINKRNGKDTLMFRVANERGNHIVEAHTTVVLSVNDITEEGDQGRILIDLELIRKSTPVFALSWSVFHVIDEKSPLYNKTAKDFEKLDAMIFVSIVGIDNTSGQTIHTRHAYNYHDILCNSRFQDILKQDVDGNRFIDFSIFHNTEKEISKSL
jgi:inward rectifier potassium channel